MKPAYETQLAIVRREMSGPITSAEQAEHDAAMAVYSLMSATQRLFELSLSKTTAHHVSREANDIELAYTRLGRLLAHVRKNQLQAAE